MRPFEHRPRRPGLRASVMTIEETWLRVLVDTRENGFDRFTRLLSDFGADVMSIESEERATGVTLSEIRLSGSPDVNTRRIAQIRALPSILTVAQIDIC